MGIGNDELDALTLYISFHVYSVGTAPVHRPPPGTFFTPPSRYLNQPGERETWFHHRSSISGSRFIFLSLRHRRFR